MPGPSARRDPPHGRDIFEDSYSGVQDRPYIPRLRSDPPPYKYSPRSLDELHQQEGKEARERRLRTLWEKLPRSINGVSGPSTSSNEGHKITYENAPKLRKLYEDELLRKCAREGSITTTLITWQDFLEYADAKELELWQIFHNELDLDGNGHLDAEELTVALGKAGIELSPAILSDFMTFLTSTQHSRAISFSEFRDFLLLLPRKASPAEIYRYYEVRKFLGDDGRGTARVTMEGDVSLSGEDRPPSTPTNLSEQTDANENKEHIEDSHANSTSFKFLLAGGIAGIVSRTCTAPFDRLKVFLITRPPDISGATLNDISGTAQAAARGARAIGGAITQIYLEGGVLAFWVGNGLSVAKIFPESAIKFFSYESSKRFFAKYVDKVEDPRDISGTSRFISGGFGGITSQLSIYPIETLKTQMQSSAGESKLGLVSAARRLWGLGGFRAYYRGLTVGLIGVFPYAAIDMSTFEALKLAYIRSTGKEEPGVLPLLAFGSISGGVGATSVYPMNLVRTRLQASGSTGHPQRYTGIWDVTLKTYQGEGWRGFYRGLVPTLAKVIPSVSISYVVYEYSKKKLGV